MKIKRFVTESDEEIQKFLDEHTGAIVKLNGVGIANGTIYTPVTVLWEDEEEILETELEALKSLKEVAMVINKDEGFYECTNADERKIFLALNYNVPSSQASKMMAMVKMIEKGVCK